MSVPGPVKPLAPFGLVGRIDTVGGTTFDWQTSGPARQTIYYDSAYGIHVCWLASSVLGSGFPDLGMRYNFWDGRTTHQWNWVAGGAFMDYGVAGWTDRTAYGMLDVSAVSGRAFLIADAFPSGQPEPVVSIVRDASPGAGNWQRNDGATGYEWPALGITDSFTVHTAQIYRPDSATRNLDYAELDTWIYPWFAPVDIGNPEPNCASQNIAVSKISHNIAITWVVEDASPPTIPLECYYKLSSDDGMTWTDSIHLPLPQDFHPGSETLVSFDVSSVYPFYDRNDSLHIVASVMPFVQGSAVPLPADIWHWTAASGWSLVHRYPFPHGAGLPKAQCGPEAIFATRPTIGEGSDGNLVCCWEQFDTVNYEPTDTLARADIFVSLSHDNGVTWSPELRITTPDHTSKRYPCIATHFKGDTCLIHYEVDLQAGITFPYGEGGATYDPQIVQFVPDQLISPGVQENPAPMPARLVLETPRPNPFHVATTVSYELPRAGEVTLVISDAAGRTIRTLVRSRALAGTYSATWNGVADNGAQVPPGVYFCTLNAANTRTCQKVTLLR
jgi:hypothetical protein